jgi:hypothetical protein
MQRCCCGTVCGGGGEQRAGRRCWRQIARAAACLRCWDGMECEREPVRVEGRVLLQSGECSVCGVCWPRGEVVWVVGEEVRSDTGAPSVALPNQAEQLWKQPRPLFRRPASRQIARNFHRPPPHRSFVGHLSASAQPSSPLRRCECCGSARPKATTLHIILLHEPGYSKLRLLYAYFTLYVCSGANTLADLPDCTTFILSTSILISPACPSSTHPSPRGHVPSHPPGSHPPNGAAPNSPSVRSVRYELAWLPSWRHPASHRGPASMPHAVSRGPSQHLQPVVLRCCQ